MDADEPPRREPVLEGGERVLRELFAAVHHERRVLVERAEMGNAARVEEARRSIAMGRDSQRLHLVVAPYADAANRLLETLAPNGLQEVVACVEIEPRDGVLDMCRHEYDAS